MEALENRILCEVQSTSGLDLANSYLVVREIMRFCLSPEDFIEFERVEDHLDAYKYEYYDTHDLDEIGENLEEYEEKYLELIEKVMKIKETYRTKKP